ncbi:MAG: trypsin-like peptidase domain-containing protein [Nitrospirae bacterium]|nr:trypsin-like peptidase domain-containing protein [Nitrospirota bacterium]
MSYSYIINEKQPPISTPHETIAVKANKSITLSTEEIVNKTKKAVVYINTPNGAGSGFVYSQEGLILTNAHVVEEYKEVEVKFYNGNTLKGSVIKLGTSPLDVAIVKVEGKGYDTILLGNSKQCSEGADAIAIGAPLGLEQTVTKGIISNCNHQKSGIQYIQIDTPVTHGNSGCPLINNKGEAIGIITGGISKTQGFNFALAINEAAQFINGELDQQNDTFKKTELADNYFTQGNTYFKLHNYLAAVEYYNKVIEIIPQYLNAYHNRGISYFLLGKNNQAIVDFNKVIELNPKASDAYSLRGMCYDNLDDDFQTLLNHKIAASMGNKYSQNYLKEKGINWN